MSLDKAIKSGKEHRKPYRKAKAVDSHCRNHGDCAYCRNNRLHNARKALAEAKYKASDADNDDDEGDLTS